MELYKVNLTRTCVTDAILNSRPRWPELYEFINFNSAHARVYTPFRKTYISNVLTEKKLDALDPKDGGTLIVSQTGTGKSTLAVNALGDIAKKRNRRVLLVAPRAALIQQYKLQVADQYDKAVLERYTSAGLKSIHEVAQFDIYSMQELADPFHRKTVFDKRNAYAFVILDEVHLFVNDASFNRYTYLVFSFLVNDIGKTASRIYLTATPDNIVESIVNAEKGIPLSYRKAIRYDLEGTELKSNRWLTVYRFEKSYPYVNLNFFSDDDAIPSLIGMPSDTNKALIFVDTKEAGQTLKRKFNESSPETADFIDADSKNGEMNDTYLDLLDSSCFKKPILIVTKFLEVGVNIKDANVRNIVICSLYRDEIEQMLGRKRIDSNETVNLFLKLPTVATLKSRMSSLRNSYWELLELIKKFPNRWDNLDTLPMPFFVEKEGSHLKLEHNHFSLTVNEQNRMHLSKLLASGDPVAAYIKMVCQTLPDCKRCFTAPTTEAAISEAVINYIDPLLGKEFGEAEFIEVGDHILELLRQPRRSDQTGIPTKSLNKAFKDKGFHYKAQDCSRDHKIKTWKIIRG